MRVVRRIYGFTMIELLIVVVIMMLGLALVGGYAIDAIDKAEARSEVVSLQSMLRKAGVIAFSSGSDVTLEFSGNLISSRSQHNHSSEKLFRHLSFGDQEVVFNKNGVPNIHVLSYTSRGFEREQILQALFEKDTLAAR